MSHPSRGMPIWIWGAIVGLLLILVSTRTHLFSPGNAALSEYFAVQPTPTGFDPSFQLPQLELGSLPPTLQKAAGELLARLQAGRAGQPVEPAVETQRLRVEVDALQRSDAGLQITGTVTNIGQDDLLVPISAFELRDSTGASYIAGGGGSATLRPGESTPLELTVPLPEGCGLLLITTLPPDPPVEQRLIVVD